MKIKIVLLIAYLVFVGIAINEWRSLASASANEERIIANYRRLAAREKALPDAKTGLPDAKPSQYLSGYEGNHQEIAYWISHEQRFITLAILLTLLPIAHLATTVKKKTPNQPPEPTSGLRPAAAHL